MGDIAATKIAVRAAVNLLQTEICRQNYQRIIYPGGETAMTQVKEETIRELDDLPPRAYGEVLDKFRRRKTALDTALASEAVLRIQENIGGYTKT